MKNYKIAVAGTGYVGLSLGVLFAQHHQVVAVDIVQAKVDMINNKKSPIQDDYIEKYLAEKDLNLTATLDAKAAYASRISWGNARGQHPNDAALLPHSTLGHNVSKSEKAFLIVSLGLLQRNEVKQLMEFGHHTADVITGKAAVFHHRNFSLIDC